MLSRDIGNHDFPVGQTGKVRRLQQPRHGNARPTTALHLGDSSGVPRLVCDGPQPRDPMEIAISRVTNPRRPRRADKRLEQVRDGLSMCVGCGCLTMRQCAIYNPQDTLGDTGSGARRIFPTQ